MAAAIDRVAENHPIVAAAVRAGLNDARADERSSVEHVDQATVANVTAAVAPIVANARNQEPPNASRVIAGTVPATILAASTFLTGLMTLVLAVPGMPLWTQILMIVTGGVGGSGNLFALFGRLKRDLPPMTYNKWNPFSWFAPRP